MYTQSQLLPDDLHPGHRNYQHNRNIHGCHQPEWRKVGPQSTANLEEIPEVNVEEYPKDWKTYRRYVFQSFGLWTGRPGRRSRYPWKRKSHRRTRLGEEIEKSLPERSKLEKDCQGMAGRADLKDEQLRNHNGDDSANRFLHRSRDQWEQDYSKESTIANIFQSIHSGYTKMPGVLPKRKLTPHTQPRSSTREESGYARYWDEGRRIPRRSKPSWSK